MKLRRPSLVLLALAAGASSLSIAACGSSSDTPASGEDAGPCGATGCADAGADAAPDSTPDADAAEEAAPEVPIPIKHVVVIVKENHTFDNYFGSFPGAEGTTQCQTSQGPVNAPHAPDRTLRDLCHAHQCALDDWNGGKMDGWLSVSGASQSGDDLFCAQYQEGDIPNYWAYAKNYALADHFFANELGPSFPGHMFFLAAQAGWATGNPNTTITWPYWGCDQSQDTRVTILDHGTCNAKDVFPCFQIPSVPDLLPSGVDWKFYGSNFYLLPEIWSMFDGIDGIRNDAAKWAHVVNASTFDGDVDNKKLPALSWLVDQDLADEHPQVGGVCDGENWTVGHINHLMQSEYWKDTVIFFSMDDFGGWYDHVLPPREYGCDAQHPYGLGFRLPLIIISPWVKPHQIYKPVAEQASIPKFILEVFKAPRFLGDVDPAAQDKQANDLMDAFDWKQTPNPPLVLKTRTCL